MLLCNSATPPCFICGYGTTCKYGGPARWMSPEEFDAFTDVTPDMFKRYEDNSDVVAECSKLAKQLVAAIQTAEKDPS